MLFSCQQLMYIFNFPFFFSINSTRYPANNCNSQIYPFLRFSLINSYRAVVLVFINLQTRKNFIIVLGLSLILQSYNAYFASLLLFRPHSLANLQYLFNTQFSLSSISLKVAFTWYYTILVSSFYYQCYIFLILTHFII